MCTLVDFLGYSEEMELYDQSDDWMRHFKNNVKYNAAGVRTDNIVSRQFLSLYWALRLQSVFFQRFYLNMPYVEASTS